MGLGYSSRCKICNLEHRSEVERLRQQGESYRAIQQWLKERGVKVSVAAIKNHFDEHFPVQKEAAERYYEQSKAVFEDAVEQRLSEIEMLDRVMAVEYELHQATGAWLKELVERRARLPMAVVALHKETAAELRQAAKTKAELLGDDPMSSLANALSALWEDDEEDADGVDTAAAGEAD